MSISAAEYIESQLTLEREAREVLPYDFKTCSWTHGPAFQTIYACQTCEKPGRGGNGVCYSCSIACHSSHELVEVGGRRSFQCDCGTTRTSSACQIDKRRDELASSGNRYNDNFYNKFCDCKQTYSEEHGTMSQCIHCQDWYHHTCLAKAGATCPDDAADEEDEDEDGTSLLCHHCLAQPILASLFAKETTTTDSSGPGDLSTKRKAGPQADDALGKKAKTEGKDDKSETAAETPADVQAAPQLTTLDEEAKQGTPGGISPESRVAAATPTSEVQKASSCTRPAIIMTTPASTPPALFLASDFRTRLCQCAGCRALYESISAPWLAEEEELYNTAGDDDGAHAAEDDESDNDSLYDAGTKALHGMDRVQALEGMAAYSKLSADLRAFLKPFADSRQEVSEAAVREFFARKFDERRAASGGGSVG